MRAGKPILVAVITVDIELAKAIHALKFFEPVKRNLARTSDELQ